MWNYQKSKEKTSIGKVVLKPVCKTFLILTIIFVTPIMNILLVGKMFFVRKENAI